MEEDTLIAQRKERLAALLGIKRHWIAYIGVLILAYFSLWLRTLNVGGLRDVATGGWTLGPDLDPFLFLRWGKYIVTHGSLMSIDTLRYVPLGSPTSAELPMLPYAIAWFHGIASHFGSVSVEQSAALLPAYAFALTVIAFFFFTQRIFIEALGATKANSIALISSFFLIVIPALLPRTIAGIPEKESIGFFFLFLTFFFYLYSLRAKTTMQAVIFGTLTGVTTACMALTWGGAAYIYHTISLTTMIMFLLGQLNRRRTYATLLWLIVNTAVILMFTTRFTLIGSLTTVPVITTSTAIIARGVQYLLANKMQNIAGHKMFNKIPKPVLSLLIVVVGGAILATLFFGTDFISGKVGEVTNNLITPISDRLGVTVAENRQPFFAEWAGSFGPVIQGIPLFFWLFFIGSIYLFHHMTHQFNKRERWTLTAAYIIFLVCTIFSRYDPNSVLNGVNTTSLLVYALGFIIFIGSVGYYYYRDYRRGETHRLQSLDASLIMFFVFFFLCIVSARGAVRLTMLLVPSSSIIVGYLIVVGSAEMRKPREDMGKIFGWIAISLIILSSVYAGYQFYQMSQGMARGYIPSSYTQQWQKAMHWVDVNAAQNAVFAHWWDYGYWVQSIGNRATVLDGGNSIPYWDHLMGRHVLTTRDTSTSLEFLYTHNVTHLLIDPTDIGKYGAFSSIGSDEQYDRRSWFAFFGKQRTEDTKNTTLIIYQGGFPLDQDIIYTTPNGTITLPEGRAAIGAIIVEENRSGSLVSQPRGIYIYQKSKSLPPAQYELPLRYLHYKNESKDFGSGVEAGIYSMPTVNPQTGAVDRSGILMYLSNKTVQSQLARFYLYEEKNPYFTMVHSEDDPIVVQLKERGLFGKDEDFVYFEGFRGPLRIWEVSYPSDIRANPAFLEIEYPSEGLRRA
ncbi:MAG TPA: STT3 domain-containing protein [Candidatus Nanoarchaeia archaeon]|nr:STT3 domain-containing protein [Candidatus Nanoarchaeia archaeon]